MKVFAIASIPQGVTIEQIQRKRPAIPFVDTIER
jgi:hypothetical protein